MRPTIRAPHGLKGGAKGPSIPASRPSTPKDGQEGALKRKVDQIAGAPTGPRPKTPNLGKGPTPARGKPMPLTFAERGEKGDKGSKGATPTPTPPASKVQTPKATQPPAGKAVGTVMPPKSKAAPDTPSEGPKPPATQPPGFAEKRFLPVPKGKAQEPAVAGGKPSTPAPTVLPPKGAGKSQPPGKAGKGSAYNKPYEPPVTPVAKAESEAGKGCKGKAVEAVAKGRDDFHVQFRLRNLESLLNRLVSELSGLPQQDRGSGASKILDAITSAAPRETLQEWVDKLAAQGIRPSNGAAEEAEEPAPDAAETAEGGEEEEPSLAQSMEDFILNVENAATTEYGKIWASLSVPREAEVEVLSALLEVTVQKTSSFDFLPKVVVELARTRKVTLPNLETSLKELAKKVEDLVQTNDQAWHLISYFLVYLFPRTRSSDWGFLFGGWNFSSWWKTTEMILQEAHKYRAFDILVLSLQIMQEKSGQKIKELPVWSDPGRASQVRQILCKWGEMDEASILETLSANGVELGK